MPIEGFDYKEFATMLSGQAKELVPAEFKDFEREYVVKTLENFSLLAGEAIANDEAAGFNADQAVLLTQIIAEWSFHKSVDVIKAGIEPEYWDGVMQKIAFTIFEIGKQAIKQNLPQEQLLELIEHHVKQSYEDALNELQSKGIIDESLKEKAANQSNIDEMMAQIEEERVQQAEQEVIQQQEVPPVQPQSQPQPQPQPQLPTEALPPVDKILKLASVALLLKNISQDKIHVILNKFDRDDAETVIQYMQMNDLERRVDVSVAVRCLNEIKSSLPVELNTESAVISKLSKTLHKFSSDELDTMFVNERKKVRQFIFNVYDNEESEFLPHVVNILAQHIESSV